MSDLTTNRALRASSILETPGTQVSPEIAASLLAAVDSDWDLLHYPSQLRFSGPSAIAVASNDPIKAEFIAGHTEDVQTQKALYDLALVEDNLRVLSALARSKHVVDEDLRILVHDTLMASSSDTTAAVQSCPPAHVVAWLESNPTPAKYPYLVAARSIADAATRGSVALAEKFVRICERNLQTSKDSSYQIENGFSALGERLAVGGCQEMAVRIANSATKTARFHILTSAWYHADVAEEVLTAAVLELVACDRDFESDKASHRASQDRNKPWYPRLLRYRTKTGYDVGSLRLLAAAFPNSLHPLVEGLTNDDPHKDLIVSLAVESGIGSLAAALLERRYSQDDRFAGPLLPDAEMFHRVALTLRDEPQPTSSGYSAPFCIPEGSAVEDVCVVLDTDGLERLVQALCNPMRRLRPVWSPTIEEFEVVLDRLALHEMRSPLIEGLYRFRDLAVESEDKLPNDKATMDSARRYIDTIANRLNAERLCSDSISLSYVATRLSEIFGTDVAGFDQALHLASVSSRPFGEVLRAVSKLHKTKP